LIFTAKKKLLIQEGDERICIEVGETGRGAPGLVM
jgi:hypothetical protein